MEERNIPPPSPSPPASVFPPLSGERRLLTTGRHEISGRRGVLRRAAISDLSRRDAIPPQRTLLELLGVVADRRGALPIAVGVSSRDELDLVCADVASLPFVSLSPLYSDQAESERASVLDKFRQATIQWNHTKAAAADIADSPKTESADSKLTIVVATDACLPQATLGEAPLMARVLINYELPTKKMES
uniref:Helicase C-terminal domain-containing protein n=1 Tax=Oryza nivara TaxID=4536 RepID=A0A0E0HTS2_ORYNI